MARRPRSSRIENRTSRLKLKPHRKPYDFTTVSPGIALGYRRNQGAGVWVVRVADGHGGNWTKVCGLADDYEDADSINVLTFWQAQDRARALARGSDDNGRPCTVSEALDDYAADLKARGAQEANALRVHHHLPPTLASKATGLLTSRELQRFRDSLVGEIKPASINRMLKGLKAALNLAAQHDPRITNTSAWRVGLAGLPDAHEARNVVLADEQARGLIAAAYAEDLAFGLFVETAAVTGARPSSLARLTVGDLQVNHSDGPRLMMPSSRKGRGHKRINRHPVPIPPSLAAKLRQAAGDREASAPLLRQRNGRDWSKGSVDYRQSFQRAAARAGLDQKVVTLYALRHTAITRELLAGLPTRVVAAGHDTSTAMIERSYSHYIGDHADAIVRRALFDTAAPPASNIVPLPAGRR
jgi:integrase